ncbi:MAG TPA: shikimate dehydrogenase [Burkholderiaceae bacterium]|nr:shikimate dehydrogenase [Burkholderiaceae bacterium]
MSALLAVIGHPVRHSRSPEIHARFAAALGRPVQYVRIEAPLDGFLATVRAFAAGGCSDANVDRTGGGAGEHGARAHGCNVTVPFKGEAWAACARLTERARRAEAVNTIHFAEGTGEGWLGDNTDGAGLLRDIEDNAGVALGGKRVLLLGAGGAAAGALDALLGARPAVLIIANRTHGRAQALATRFDAIAQGFGVRLDVAAPQAAGIGFDVVVNATSASLQAQLPPLPSGVLARGGLALDMMYGPAAKPFLEWARRLGAVPRDGLGMLVEQAAEAWVTWFGARPDTRATLAALRRDVDAAG